MAARKALSKKIRFEVFKRDKFTCQYCGAKAPDVILEVDHIKPVAKGGTNDILNLVTACRECNRGKTDKTLSDDTVLVKQRNQLEAIQARREMIELMAQWKSEMLIQAEKELEIAENMLIELLDIKGLTDHGRLKMKRLIERYGLNEVCEAIEISCMKYDDKEVAVDKIGGICYNRAIGRGADYYK